MNYGVHKNMYTCSPYWLHIFVVYTGHVVETHRVLKWKSKCVAPSSRPLLTCRFIYVMRATSAYAGQ